MWFQNPIFWIKVLGWGKAGLDFCLRHWRETLIVFLAVLAYHNFAASRTWEKRTEVCGQARKADHAAYVLAQLEAKKKNVAEINLAESKWKDSAEHIKVIYDLKLKVAYGTVADYARRMRASPQGTAGVRDISSTPDAAQGTDGPGQGSLIPVPIGDLNVCAENTVKAQEWQDYWKGVIKGWPKSQ